MGRHIKMALSSSLATRCHLLRGTKGFRWIHSTASVGVMKPVAATESDAGYLKEGFWDKNKRLERPMSPHLTIYKMQMTSILSITHRGTGLAQSAIMYGYAIAAVTATQNHAALLASLQASGMAGAATLTAAKFLIAWPFTFHLFNGCRHLSWD